MKYFLSKIKSGIKYFCHAFCVKIDMDTQIEINRKAEKICKDVETYLQQIDERDYIPSCDEFYQKYGYNVYDILPLIGNKDLSIALNKINIQERAMLKNFIIMTEPEYVDSKGVTHKFDKKGIHKRFDKVFKNG